MGRLDLPDKYRDEDLTERRKVSRRIFNTVTGRRKTDLNKERYTRGRPGFDVEIEKHDCES